MVDFNNDVTVGTPAADVERISILQRRYDLIEAYESYKKGRFQNAPTPLSIVRARLVSLFLELQAALQRRLPQKEYEGLKDLIFAIKFDEDDFLKCFFNINNELDTIKLIKIDNQRVYDYQDTELENKEKGY